MLSTSSDIRQGDALLQLAPDRAEAIFGDKGYDSDVFYSSHLRERDESGFPQCNNRFVRRDCDWFYKDCSLWIECLFGKIKCVFTI